MTERLTEEFKDGRNILRKGIENIHHVGFGQFYAGEAVDKLAEYETAEEEGRLVVLPCGTVYFIHNKAIRTKSILDLLVWEIDGIDKGGEHWSTREKAEKALKEMEGKQGE